MSTWILLRGLTREKRHWHDFPQQLAEALPGAQVIPLELPGNGVLNAVSSPTSVAGLADHCRAEVARLGIGPPYSLLAMSLGAMVATAWAASHPDEIEACVLINTSFGGFSPIHHRLRPRAWPRLLRCLATPSDESREQQIFDLTTRLAVPAGPVLESWVAIRRTRPVQGWNGLRQLIAAARFRAPNTTPVPTLVLGSAGDRLVDPRCSMEIARCWRCAIAVHPKAGHDLPLDDGAWVTRKVAAWLNKAVRPDEDNQPVP